MKTESFPKIYFYIKNYKKIPRDMILDADAFYNTRPYGVTDGENAWLLKTWQYLRRGGIDCELVDFIPDSGILFYTFENFKYGQRPSNKLLFVYIKGDKPPHPYSNCLIVQNAYEKLACRGANFITHWPQPNLQPRDVNRGERFENIAYLGVHGSLAAELKTSEWQEQLASINLNWIIQSQPQQWAEYRDIDAVLAVRSFSLRQPNKYTKDQGKWKPATKLYNSWLAGVIPILGDEPSFRELRKSDLDYLEVSSPDEAFESLLRLKEDSKLRRAMLENGRARGQAFSIEAITQEWIDFIDQIAVPSWQEWCHESVIMRQLFFFKKFVSMKAYHYKNKLVQRQS